MADQKPVDMAPKPTAPRKPKTVSVKAGAGNTPVKITTR